MSCCPKGCKTFQRNLIAMAYLVRGGFDYALPTRDVEEPEVSKC